MFPEAVARYHDLLADQDLAENSRATLDQGLERAKLIFGGRRLSPYLRPHFVTETDFARICRICETVWSAIQKVKDATEGRGADLTIETTGVMKQLADSVHMTRFGGKVQMFGIYTVKEGALPFYDLYFKEISLITARVAKAEDYPASIALVERGQVRLEPLVSDVMPLGELKAAIGMLASDSGQRMKIILDHS